jgi:hypothetical protein
LAYTSFSSLAAVLRVFLNEIEKPADGFLVVVVLLAFHDDLKAREEHVQEQTDA